MLLTGETFDGIQHGGRCWRSVTFQQNVSWHVHSIDQKGRVCFFLIFTPVLKFAELGTKTEEKLLSFVKREDKEPVEAFSFMVRPSAFCSENKSKQFG